MRGVEWRWERVVSWRTVVEREEVAMTYVLGHLGDAQRALWDLFFRALA